MSPASLEREKEKNGGINQTPLLLLTASEGKEAGGDGAGARPGGRGLDDGNDLRSPAAATLLLPLTGRRRLGGAPRDKRGGGTHRRGRGRVDNVVAGRVLHRHGNHGPGGRPRVVEGGRGDPTTG